MAGRGRVGRRLRRRVAEGEWGWFDVVDGGTSCCVFQRVIGNSGSYGVAGSEPLSIAQRESAHGTAISCENPQPRARPRARARARARPRARARARARPNHSRRQPSFVIKGPRWGPDTVASSQARHAVPWFGLTSSLRHCLPEINLLTAPAPPHTRSPQDSLPRYPLPNSPG